MKKLTLSALLTTTLATCIMVLPAHAQTDNTERQQKRMQHKIERISNKLDLNENQQTQWAELAKAQHAQKMESRKKMHELHKQLREAQKQSPADSNEIKTIADKIADQTRQNVLLRVEHQQALKQILNEEQLAELEKMHDKRKKRHDKRDEKHKH